jgi:hypothetical protein
MSALGCPQDIFSDTTIQLQPVLAQWIQNTHALTPSLTTPCNFGRRDTSSSRRLQQKKLKIP